MNSNSSSHSVLIGMQNVIANLENNVAVSYKAVFDSPQQCSKCVSSYLPNVFEVVCPHIYLHSIFLISALFIIIKTWKQSNSLAILFSQ